MSVAKDKIIRCVSDIFNPFHFICGRIKSTAKHVPILGEIYFIINIGLLGFIVDFSVSGGVAQKDKR